MVQDNKMQKNILKFLGSFLGVLVVSFVLTILSSQKAEAAKPTVALQVQDYAGNWQSSSAAVYNVSSYLADPTLDGQIRWQTTNATNCLRHTDTPSYGPMRWSGWEEGTSTPIVLPDGQEGIGETINGNAATLSLICTSSTGESATASVAVTVINAQVNSCSATNWGTGENVPEGSNVPYSTSLIVVCDVSLVNLPSSIGTNPTVLWSTGGGLWWGGDNVQTDGLTHLTVTKLIGIGYGLHSIYPYQISGNGITLHTSGAALHIYGPSPPPPAVAPTVRNFHGAGNVTQTWAVGLGIVDNTGMTNNTRSEIGQYGIYTYTGANGSNDCAANTNIHHTYNGSNMPMSIGSEFATTMDGLTPSTRYWYRTFATNMAGLTGISTDCFNFTTEDLTPVISLSAQNLSVQYGEKTTMSWTLANVDHCTKNSTPAGWSGTITATGSGDSSAIVADTTFWIECFKANGTSLGRSQDVLVKLAGGNCIYNGGGEINAMFLCKGTLTVQDNSQMTGSFVAKNFNVGANPVNVNFFFDYNIDSHVPPGFRTLIVPKSSEVGNKP